MSATASSPSAVRPGDLPFDIDPAQAIWLGGRSFQFEFLTIDGKRYARPLSHTLIEAQQCPVSGRSPIEPQPQPECRLSATGPNSQTPSSTPGDSFPEDI